MQDPIADLESRLAAVEKRLAVLEDAAPVSVTADRLAPEPALREGFVADASTHLGRVLLIFGGAYLLRAITDFEFVPRTIGILMGASYALFWLAMAYRRGGEKNRRASAMFYGGTSVVLALPLLVEAITRFDLLSGRQAVTALIVFYTLALIVASRRNLASLGWLATAGSIATAFAITIVSHTAVSVAVFLILLGIGSLWSAYGRRWMGLQWLGALGANAGVVTVLVLSGSERWAIDPLSAVVMGSVLLLAYLMSFAVRSHIRGHELGIFEIVQALVACGIAFWAAALSAVDGRLSFFAAGVLGVGLSACAYALAFSAQTWAARGRNFYVYSTLGLVLMLAGSILVLPPGAVSAIWCLMALAMAWTSGRTGSVGLSLQCTVLLIAAGVSSGILATGLEALAGGASATWPALTPLHAGVALTTVVCLFLPVAQHSERWGLLAGLPQLVVLGLSVWQVGGLIVVVLAPVLAAVNLPEPNLAVLAALRTAVLSASSVTLALSSRFRRWPEARWLVYPVLILVGIKLFLEDFPNGEPATLFVALGFVGSALLLVARLIRRGGGANRSQGRVGGPAGPLRRSSALQEREVHHGG